MRYHFDIVDKVTFADLDGRELPDDVAAMDVAHLLARRLTAECPEFARYSVTVTDEAGEEICRVPINPTPH